jgi:hypothetical protein
LFDGSDSLFSVSRLHPIWLLSYRLLLDDKAIGPRINGKDPSGHAARKETKAPSGKYQNGRRGDP